MKIALSFSGCYRRGGVERILFECARYLASREHAVTVFANEWERDETQSIQYQSVPMHRRLPFLRGISYFRACSRQLRHEEYDVLGTFGCVCPIGGVLWVQSVHRSWLEHAKAFRAPFSGARLRHRLNPAHPILLHLEAKHFRQRNYAKIIAATPEVQKDLNRYYGISDEDVIVIPNGFAPTEFNPERRMQRRTEIRGRLGLDPSEIALLFVANELDRKGFTTILSALRQLKRPQIRLLVVGRAPIRDVQKQAARYGLSEQVMACGPSRDIAGFHAACDIFVLPTQYEAFCLAILEALGSGMPVVTTNVPGASDAIQPGVNGFLIEDPNSGPQLAAALEPLLEADVRERLSLMTPATVRQYQWPTVLGSYEKVLRQCCHTPSRKGSPMPSGSVSGSPSASTD